MSEPPESTKTPNKRAAVGIRLGSTTLELTGAKALIAVLVLLSVLVLIVYLVSITSNSPLWVSAVLWMVFIGYWSAVAGSASATRLSEPVRSRQVHQLLMYGALALEFVRVPGLLRRWVPGTQWVALIGLAVHVSSILFAVWARRHLGRNWSGAITAKVDHQLVRNGPYKLVRHPIYTAMLGMFLGTAMVSGELHALVGTIVMAVAYLRKIRIEERHLQSVFGSDYDEYRKKSWALIPGLL